MSNWALNASRKKGNGFIPGSSKFISNELSLQFSIASSNLDNHFTTIKDQINSLSEFMNKVYDNDDEIKHLGAIDEEIINNSPVKVIQPTSIITPNENLEIPISKESEKISQGEVKLFPGQQIETLEKLNHLTKNNHTSPIKIPKLKPIISQKDDIDLNNTTSPFDKIENHANSRENHKTDQFKSSQSKTVDPKTSRNSTRISSESNNLPNRELVNQESDDQVHSKYVEKDARANSSPNDDFQNTGIQNTTFESASEDSFQAISTAIRKSIAGKKRDENNNRQIPKTPRTRSSIFVSLPAREPLLLKSTSKPKSTTKNKIESGFKLSPVKLIPRTDVSKLTGESLKTEDLQSSPEKVNLFTSNEPTKNLTEEVQPTITLWDKISQYRALSPKKYSLSPIKLDTTFRIKKSPVKNFSLKSPTKASNRSPIKSTIKAARESPIKPNILRSPTNPQLKKHTTPHKSPTSRLFAQTVSSAAKKVQPKKIEIPNKQLRPRSARKALKLNDILPNTEITNLPKLTKKSMMEQRSEAAALKPRQKIVVKLRKSEVSKSTLPPQTPAKTYTPDNLPKILSDDNHKTLKSWGKTPEIFKIAKLKKHVDPSKIFRKKTSVDLMEVFNTQMLTSPAPTPDKNDKDKLEYQKIMGYE
ncbi:uncharacterized protein KGF55_004189 [Candida pseudojiufengensis]|uniref:uncharacterized protein n=1 Tax=Candida pseudojiufengensis TaxID=497109 RepID=UPI0022257D85|nr:uncharacterized protein KGF55_004189 [Candida pseudojiufengensis]KAI5961264.1 hypothetical protein KGF55_004189 [Candida pseudojiufengensis]